MENKEYQTELLTEYKELIERRIIVERSVNIEHYYNVENEQGELLCKQLEAMSQYEEILFTRIIKLMK